LERAMGEPRRKIILIVEDETIIAMNERRILEKYGYEVMTASSGETALEAIQAEDSGIDLVLMDINLGKGIDGTEAAIRILAERDLPLIFLSSHTEREIVEKTEGITSYGYIVKNSGETVLIASVKMAFRLYEARIQEREKEQTLQESQALYHSFVEQMPAGVFRKDAAGRYIFVNSIFCRLKGLAAEEILGKTPCELSQCESALDAAAPSERALAAQGDLDHRTIMGTGRSIERIEQYAMPDGSIQYIQVKKSPVFSSSGDVVGTQGVQFDITERKREEETLIRTEAKITALLEEKELLLKETHHRVKNYLAVINSLLSLQANSQGDETVRSALNGAALRVQGMVLLYDKLYRSKVDGELGVREFLPPLIDQIVAVYVGPKPIEKDVLIEDFSLGANLLSSIGLMINELITNSIKHAFAGVDECRLTISASRNGDEVTMVYGDNGVGLPDTIATGKSQGFGMQLIEMLVRQMRGTLAIDRRPGAKFTITFRV
jgi:PAS domain S-box-containing protein